MWRAPVCLRWLLGDLAVSQWGTISLLTQQERIEVQQERLNLKVPTPLYDSLKALSQRDGRSVPELARAALVEFVSKSKQA